MSYNRNNETSSQPNKQLTFETVTFFAVSPFNICVMYSNFNQDYYFFIKQDSI